MDRGYAWLRRNPWLVDGLLAVVLVAGSANAFVYEPGVLPATIALAGAVAVRRWFPVAAFGTAVAIGAAQVAAGFGPKFAGGPLQPTFADAGILVLLYTVAATRARRTSLASLAVCVALCAAAVARWNPGPERAHNIVQFMIVTSLFYILAPVSAWVLGDSMGYRRAYAAALEDRAVRAEQERDAQAQIAAAAERARIARELHDVIAHSLSVMVAQADGGRYAFDARPDRSRQALTEIGATGRQALAEMRHLLGVLRTGDETAELAPAPGIAEIPDLAARARDAGMRVTQAVEGEARPVPGGLSLAAYRIVQEALTNVRKHAGSGAAAKVTLCFRQHELLVRVTDDGGGVAASLPHYAPPALRGAGPAGNGAAGHGASGHGLAGMRERAAMYGGKVQAGPRPDGGFEVTARLQLPAAPGAA